MSAGRSASSLDAVVASPVVPLSSSVNIILEGTKLSYPTKARKPLSSQGSRGEIWQALWAAVSAQTFGSKAVARKRTSDGDSESRFTVAFTSRTVVLIVM
jgi:hypothetical protein